MRGLRLDGEVDGLQVRVLGALAVHRHGQEVAVAGRRQRALLAALVVGGGPVSVGRLVDAVWEDDPPAAATTTLQTYVSRLRGLLGADAIEHGPGGYRLHQSVDTDVALLRSLVADVERAQHPAVRADLARRALDLWRGPTLGELADHAWFRPVGVELDELRRSLVETAGAALVAGGRSAAAVPLLESQIAEVPLREPTQVLLVRALHASGRAIDALRAADRYRAQLREETGLDPGAELLAAEQEVLSGESTTAAAAATPAHSADLPRGTELLGRERELAELADLVDRSQLVTVTGIGGVGKTRLVAELVASARPGRWTVVDLERVQAGGVAGAVRAALGFRAQGPEVPLGQLVGGAPVALVLDGCEGVVGEVRDVVRELLRGAREAHIVATSRVRLALPEEHVVPLGPLPTAGADAAAVRLFLDRLARTPTGAGIHDEAALTEVCRRLDGIPLALELAASRAAALGIPVLLERLDDAVDVTGRGEPGSTSLGEVLAWSVELLDEPAQQVLFALGAFRGEIDLEAAEAVAGCSVREPVAPALARLVDASLLSVRTPGTWDLLDVVRRYARHRLDEQGAAGEVRWSHARWVGQRLARIDRASVGSSETRTVAELDAVRADVEGAVGWALRAGDVESLVAVAVALAGPLLYRPDAELLGLLRTIASADGIAGTSAEAPVLAASARAAFLLGDLDDVDAAADRALELAADAATQSRALHAKGVLRLYQGEPAEAGACFAGALARAAAPAARLDALGGLALADTYAEELGSAAHRVDELAALADAVESDTYRAFAEYARGELALAHGDVDVAVADLSAASDRAWSVGAPFVWGIASTVLGQVLVRHRPVDEATRHLSLLLDRWRRTATWPQLWTTMRLVAELLARRGDDDVALLVLEAAAGDPAAPTPTGADADRDEAVRSQLAERLGPGAVAGIRAAAGSLTRSAVLDRAARALRSTSS